MILFSTPATQHLAQKIAAHHGACTIKKFNDGELFVRIDEDVRNKHVWVLACTQAPAENILSLFFLLDALARSGANISLFITYFGYARHVIAAPGEACTAQVMGTLLNTFTIAYTVIVHPHSAILHDFLPFTVVRDTEFFYRHAQSYDAIAAPDTGASTFARDIAQHCNKELILVTKKRPEHEQVEVLSVQGSPEHKNILIIDDMISTGRTVVSAAHALAQRGAKTIVVAATHGVFSPGARDFLEQSPLERIFVTNTIAQESAGKIVVEDCSALIQTIMQHYTI